MTRSFPMPLLVSLAVLSAIAPMAIDTYLPAFTQIGDDLGVSASLVQLTMTMFLVGAAMGQLVFGVLSDRRGRRPYILGGTILAVLAGAAAALAPSIGVLLAARFLQGLGAAAGMVLGRAVIADSARGSDAARAMGVVMAIQGIAPVVAPLLGGSLVGVIGWRGILWIVAGCSAAGLVCAFAFIPESLPEERRSAGGFASLRDGTRALVADGEFMRLILALGLAFALLMGHLSAAPFILQRILGMSTMGFTAVFAACALMVTVVSSVSGSLAARIPPARQARLALATICCVDVAFAAVCFLALREPQGASVFHVVVPMLQMLHLACLGAIFGNLSVCALDRTGRQAGTGSALMGFLQFVLGGLVSPLVGLTGETSAVAFGIVILVAAILANVLAQGILARESQASIRHRVEHALAAESE